MSISGMMKLMNKRAIVLLPLVNIRRIYAFRAIGVFYLSA